MANWWDEAPLAGSAPGPKAPAAANWWDEAPLANAGQQPAPAGTDDETVYRELLAKYMPEGKPFVPASGIAETPEQMQAYVRSLVPQERQQRQGLAAEDTARKKGTFERFTNAVVDPALLGFRDELVGGGVAAGEALAYPFQRATWTGEARPGLGERMGAAYERTRDEIRAEQRANEKDFGWGPGLLGAALMGPGRAATAVAPNFLSRVGQSARVGAGFGGAAGVGYTESAPETSLGEAAANRLWGGTKGALWGAGLAPAISEVAVPAALALGRGTSAAAQYASRAVQAARNPEQAGIEAVADKLVATGVDPQAIRGMLTPRLSANLQARGITDEHLAAIISRQMNGETAATVAQAHGIAPQTARNYFLRYQESNPTPLNIIDVAKELAGPGGSTPVTRMGRAAASLAGDEGGAAAVEALMGRQQTQSGRVANIIRRSVNDQDFEAALAAAQQNLRNESRTAYQQFYSEPDLAIGQLADLMEDPLFRRANIQAQRHARVEAIRTNQEALRAGRPPAEPVPTVDAANEVFSPQMLDFIQRQLRIAGEGFATNASKHHAQNLRQIFLDRIQQHYPSFAGIRANYASGLMEQQALTSGEGIATRLGAPAREVLQDFETMTPAQQELTRIGFARKLLDQALNAREGGAVANQFQTPAVREIVERLFPRSSGNEVYQRGQDLLRRLRREATTTATKNDVLAGSRTAELQNDMGRMMEGAEVAANVATGRFSKVLGNLATRLTSEIGSRGATQVLRILTETDPARLLPLLNQLTQAATTTAQRRAYLDAARQIRMRAYPALGAPVGQVAGGLAAEQPLPVAAR